MARPPDPRYASGSGPVSRRQVLRNKLGAPLVNPLALQRLKRMRALQTLGKPLEQLMQAGQGGAPRAPGALGLTAAVLLATGGVGLLLAWLQSSQALALASVAALTGSLVAGLARARRAQRAPPVFAVGAAFDAPSLRKLDTVLEAVAPDVGEEIFGRLLALKASLARMADMLPRADGDEHFTLDDKLYVVECVRRYLPDSIEAYLLVPPAQRTTSVLEDGRSARDVLREQLALLQAELDRREDKLGRSAAEGLMRQQRFLKAKAGN